MKQEGPSLRNLSEQLAQLQQQQAANTATLNVKKEQRRVLEIKTASDIPDTEYEKFRETGEASTEIITRIAEKIKAGTGTTEREQEIYSGQAAKIENILTNERNKEAVKKITATKESLNTIFKSAQTSPEVRDQTAAQEYALYSKQFSKEQAKHGLGNIVHEIPTLVPEFESLSPGQKMIVMEGLTDRLYKKVTREAQNRFQEKLASSGTVGKIWKSARKQFITAGYEKEIRAELANPTNKTFIKDTVEELTGITQDSGLNAYLSADKKTVITNFSGPFYEAASQYSKEKASVYNEKASALARIPKAWRSPEATSSQRAAFEKATSEFNIARDYLLTEVSTQARKEGVADYKAVAVEYVRKSELMMRTMSGLSSHLDAGKALRRIGTANKYMRGLQDKVTERGAAAAYGYTIVAAKSALRFSGLVGSTLIYASAPVTGALLGYLGGKRRAHQSIREQAGRAREGGEKSNLTGILSDATRKTAQLGQYIEKLEDVSDPIARQKILSEIKTRADYIEAQLELGRINYGGEKDQFRREYDLMTKLQEARTILALELLEPEMQNIFSADGTETQEGADRARSLLKKIGAENFAQTEENRAKYIKEIIKSSVKWGALFGSVGAFIGYAGHEFGWFGSGASNTGSVTNNESIVDSTQETTTPIPSTETPVDTVHAETLKDTTVHSETTPTDATGAPKAPGTIVPEKIPASEPTLSVEGVGIDQGEGAGQAILNFRNSPGFEKLSPEIQKFFKGDLWDIAKKLNVMNEDGTQSALVHEGDHIGVVGNKVVLLNADGKEIQTLGTFKDGVFTEGDPKFEYTGSVEDTDTGTPEDVDTSDTETPEVSPANDFEIIPNADASKSFSGLHEKEAALNKTLNNLESTRTPTTAVEISPEQEILIQQAAKDKIENELNDYFGTRDDIYGVIKRGSESAEWKSIANKPAWEFLKEDPRYILPRYRKFQTDLFERAAEVGLTDSGSLTMQEYLDKLFEMEARKEVLAILAK